MKLTQKDLEAAVEQLKSKRAARRGAEPAKRISFGDILALLKDPLVQTLLSLLLDKLKTKA